MTRLNTQFSVKGITLLNSVMASSSSVQFKKSLFNEVDDIAGNEVSPTKQTTARNQNSIGTEWRKTLGETRLSRGTSSPLTRRTIVSLLIFLGSGIFLCWCKVVVQADISSLSHRKQNLLDCGVCISKC